MRWVRFDTPLNIKPATTILLQIRPIQSSLNQPFMQYLFNEEEFKRCQELFNTAALFERLLQILLNIDTQFSTELRLELYGYLVSQLHYHTDDTTKEKIIKDWEGAHFQKWINTARKEINRRKLSKIN